MVKKFKLKSKGRWNVLYEEGKWLLGIYSPEFRNREDVKVLEKHNAPEFFLLLEGDITILVSDDGQKIKSVRMKKGEGIVLDCWHNAYSKTGRGVALVVERQGIKTKFIEIK